MPDGQKAIVLLIFMDIDARWAIGMIIIAEGFMDIDARWSLMPDGQLG